MIIIENTENLTGVTIKGDPNDFRQLVDAFYFIAIDEDDEKNGAYFNISTRVLGLCYDIRHASMGHREFSLENHGIPLDYISDKLDSTPENNLYCSCNCLYPEMMFIMLALNELVIIKMSQLQKSRGYKDAFHKNVVWDPTIAVIRNFQAAFNTCVKNTLSESSYTRWLGVMNKDFINIEDINDHYIDLYNIKYMDMTKETRLKRLSSIAKKLSEFKNDAEHKKIVYSIKEGAKELGCYEFQVKLRGFDYPEIIEW